MKLTTAAVALVVAGTSAPALAQYGETPSPAASSAQPQSSAPEKAKGIRPSDQAMKAMIELAGCGQSQ